MVRGDFVHALLNYERAMSAGVENGPDQAEHQRICQSGISRSAVGSGDIRKGISLAVQSNDRVLMKQCAAILEDNKVCFLSKLSMNCQETCPYCLWLPCNRSISWKQLNCMRLLATKTRLLYCILVWKIGHKWASSFNMWRNLKFTSPMQR